MHRIEFSNLAAKELEKIYNIDKRLYSRLIAAIETLRTNPQQRRSLKGKLSGDYSLRVGNYHVIYTIHKNRIVVYIIDLGHRKDIYR
ncbi:type II toxin-antitoxin system RelE/ParE family toxin [Candidatus Omnitrophota bacterium]